MNKEEIKPKTEDNKIETNDKKVEADFKKATAKSSAERENLPMTAKSSGVPVSKKKKGFSFRLGGVNPLKLTFAMRHLGIMLKSGLSLEAAVSILAEQLDDQRLKEIFQEILVDINHGISVAESMRKHKDVFSNLVISLISSGEQGGTLEKNLFLLADYLKKAHELQQKVKGAMIYPLIVFGMTSFEVLGVVYFLLPRLESMFTTFGDLPEFTKIVLDVSKFIRDNTNTLAIGGVVGFFVISTFLKKTKIGKRIRDWLSLNFPVFKNLNKNNILATFSQTFALLLENGIPITNSLDIASETSDNTIYSEALEKIKASVQSGLSLSQSMMFYTNLFPVTYIKMIEIGEQTGSLSDTLIYVHDFYAEEAMEISSNLATLLEPILLIFIGVMIGGLAIIIIGPIYQLMGTING
jgi:type IV pilus assembly protein PilC